jgi:release factor glutamine methyltransferase
MAKSFEGYLEQLTCDLSILQDKPEETPLDTLRSLWLLAAGIATSVDRSKDYDLPKLTPEQIAVLDELILRRLANVPLSHLTGRQSFMGLEFLCGPEALIPRKETEILASTAVKLLLEMDQTAVQVVDACTGAGNVALAIACTVPGALVYGSDISEHAIDLANRNAEFHDKISTVNFYSGDLLEPLSTLGLNGKIDLLTCNPPYISTAKVSELPVEISSFEPKEAFDGGPFGVNLIRRLISEADTFIRPQGYLAFEVGLGQSDLICKLVEKSCKYCNIYTVQDEQGSPRVIVAQKH